MLIRISLIIAILAALAVGALNFVKVKEKITTLKDQRDTEQKAKVEAQTERDKTKADLDKTTKDLKQTKDTLELTSAERDKAVTEAAIQLAKATELTEKLAKTTQDRDDAQANLQRYKLTGFQPEQILAFGKQIKDAQDALEVAMEEKKILLHELAKTKARLAKYEDREWTPPALPANLKGKILVADPKWEFVVLDVGENQGVLEDGELLVNRNGKLIAKIRVRSVQKDRSIANVLPGWKLADLMEGDQVIAANPAS
jgi:hypothetical protein